MSKGLQKELRECPFCDKTDKVTIYTESMAQHGKLLWIRYGVKCKRCHFGIPTCAKKATAIRKWNTRPAEAALSAEAEHLKAALKDMCELWESMGKQIPPLLNELRYIHAKAFVGTDTDVPTKESEAEK